LWAGAFLYHEILCFKFLCQNKIKIAHYMLSKFKWKKLNLKGTMLVLIFLTLSLIFWLAIKLVIPKMFGKIEKAQGMARRTELNREHTMVR